MYPQAHGFLVFSLFAIQKAASLIPDLLGYVQVTHISGSPPLEKALHDWETVGSCVTQPLPARGGIAQ